MLTGFSIFNILNFLVKFNIFLLFSNMEHNIVGNPIFVQKESTIKNTRLEIVSSLVSFLAKVL